ncbi:MAG: hypothetical protein ACOX2U_06890 [Limisphaerales bacterium]|jgi:hypothetical protein
MKKDLIIFITIFITVFLLVGALAYFFDSSTISIVASLIISLSCGIFGIWKWMKNLSLIQARHINELAEKIRTDKDIEDTIYRIEYGEEWYNEDFHRSRDTERAVDKTLLYFSHAMYLSEEKIIDEKEFAFFEYNIKRMLSDSQMQDYFYNLYHFSKKKNLPFPFNSLLEYAKKNKLFHCDFFDPTAYGEKPRYHHYLNF